jgi:hypothetical protein
MKFIARIGLVPVVLLVSCGSPATPAGLGPGASPAASASPSPGPGAPGSDPACIPPEGNPWVPRVDGASSANHDSSVVVTKQKFEAIGPIIGLSQPAGSGQEIEIEIPVPEGLGSSGSISLVAENTEFPDSMTGGAFPMLVSLQDGQQEWIKLSRSGSGGDCAAAGYFECNESECAPARGCHLGNGSAFFSFDDWLQHQANQFGFLSVNTFPTCNWSNGTPACPFNSSFFVPGNRLRTGAGVVYRARYLLIADSYSTVPRGSQGKISVTVLKKTSSSQSGAVDLNLILVGTKNIADSRTPEGQRNLDALLARVSEHYRQPSVGIRLGRIRAIEWGCDRGGDAFANTELDRLGELFAAGSALLPADLDGQALNLFLVSSLSELGPGHSVLGVAGAINGPMLNGTAASGLAFSSFNHLAQYDERDADFIDMAVTVSHEMGHFLGLNHLSEATGDLHDPLPDTPVCTNTQATPFGMRILTVNSCLSDPHVFPESNQSCNQVCAGYDGVTRFCTHRPECQFNHMMWWTTKNYSAATGQGDGALFSPDSGVIIRFNPLVN